MTSTAEGAAMTPVAPADLSAYADITEVALSPDGRLLAAAVATPDTGANRYRRDVLLGPADGALAALDASAPGATRMPRWSADGAALAVVTDAPGGCSVVVVDPASGAATAVVSDWPDAIEELCWSPDGTRLLLVVREPVDRGYWETPEDRRPPMRLTRLRYHEDGIGWLAGRPRQAYLVTAAHTGAAPVSPGIAVPAASATPGVPRKLSSGGFDDAEFSWLPGGDAVLYVSQRRDDADRTPDNEIYLQPIGGEPRRLTRTPMGYSAPRASPDGTRVAFTMVDIDAYPAATHLGVLDLATGEVVDLAAGLDRDCHGDSVVWVDDATILALVDAQGRIGVRRFSTGGGDPEVVAGGDRRITAFDVRAGRIAAVCSGPADPPILVTDILTAASDPATVGAGGAHGAHVAHDPNAAIRGARSLGVPVHRAVTTAPGVAVDSWLVRPDPDRWAGPHPVILWLQGGGTQYGFQFSHEMQLLVSAGYAVLYCNPRGSAGYGTAWMRAVSGERAEHPGSGWGGDDIADAAAVVRQTLAANPDLDPARVGVMGGSYGGLVTTQLLAQTDLFAAGWAERGPYNLYSDAGTKDEAPWFFGAYLGASHLDDAESYWRASPIRRVADITAPLAIVHSEQDYRCTIGQAEELFMALKLLGREVEFVRFPGEGHSLTRNGTPVHRLQRLEILLEWFGRHLGPEPAGDRRER